MSFRKRNVQITQSRTSGIPTKSPINSGARDSETESTLPRGIRPSPADGRSVASTGCSSLDSLLGGHAGLPTGTSILIEESGTTDYASTLLRYYAAEGVLQGHTVIVVGVGEEWSRTLPGPADNGSTNESSDGPKDEAVHRAGVEEKRSQRTEQSVGDAKARERMRIAWRYEKLGQEEAEKRAAADHALSASAAYCHTFDLTRRLSLPSPEAIFYIPLNNTASTLSSVRSRLEAQLAKDPKQPTRIVIPSFLSPFIYSQQLVTPLVVLPFVHALRALLRRHADSLMIMLSLPLTIYPRTAGFMRWIEILCDGVVELTPFPHSVDAGPATRADTKDPQGLVRIHKVPVESERGGGGSLGGDDLVFTVSRRRFEIGLYSLPPVEGDHEGQAGVGEGTPKVNIDF